MLSYGKGQKVPCWLDNKEYTPIADKLLANCTIGRLAGFADVAFALWMPRLYHRYCKCDNALQKSRPHLHRPFTCSVFFCTAFNFGSNVWMFRHRDVLNLVLGLCAVQALGNFDHKKGGHLVLWDLKLVVEFPASALILLPSATIAHSNVPIAGGIFRYVDNNFQTIDELWEDPEEYERVMALKASQERRASASLAH
ncbi:hypothetical protein DFH09DRAFT_1332610 [Mycena vulgaris]|nr:hypothetical protein DFH09DRAFT_1332610 [Mycena vulgaris]